jgi:hypothetical protein
VQRKLAWSGLSRRLSGDYEPFPESEEAMIYGAMHEWGPARRRVRVHGLKRGDEALSVHTEK